MEQSHTSPPGWFHGSARCPGARHYFHASRTSGHDSGLNLAVNTPLPILKHLIRLSVVFVSKATLITPRPPGQVETPSLSLPASTTCAPGTPSPPRISPVEAFYPSSTGQLRDHLQIPSHIERRIPGAPTWSRFRHRKKSRLCPLWRQGFPPPIRTQLALWPQHSAIASYFQSVPDGSAKSLSRFTWLFHRFLASSDVQSWESALGIQGGSIFVDTLLCPPLCPLR